MIIETIKYKDYNIYKHSNGKIFAELSEVVNINDAKELIDFWIYYSDHQTKLDDQFGIDNDDS